MESRARPAYRAELLAGDLSGKRACKQALLAEYGLPQDDLDRPLLAIISRFAAQKGFDILADAASRLMQEDLNLVVLGSGDLPYETMFRTLAETYPQKVGLRVGYDTGLSHRIEAGADMFLMPSRYEPCGLNQIYSLKYGTVPVVRATGGLDDTIDDGTGFKFRDYSGDALLEAVRLALKAYREYGAIGFAGCGGAWRKISPGAPRPASTWNCTGGLVAS